MFCSRTNKILQPNPKFWLSISDIPQQIRAPLCLLAFFRQASMFVEAGGVRTAFSMPEVLSISLGGSSKVHIDNATRSIKVGPSSVRYPLTYKVKVLEVRFLH